MSAGLLFVTAPQADHKAINLLLLHLRDWEYDCGDQFRIVTTKNAYDLEISPAFLPSGDKNIGETSPPVESNLDNAWAGATIEDVEGFCLDIERANENGDNKSEDEASMFIIVDSEALEKRECVLASRANIWGDDDEPVWLEKFTKMRVPWEELYAIWVNLELANMNWEEFTLEGEEKEIGLDSSPEDCWYEHRSVSEGADMSEKIRKRRDDEVDSKW